MYSRNLTQVVATVLLSSLLGACGGSSGGGNGSSPAESEPGDPTVPDTSDPTTPSEPETGTSSRVTSVSHDFDNNGTVDGVETVSYNDRGQVSELRYIYTDDGTPDRIDGVSRLLFADYNRNLSYTYNNNGQLIQEIDSQSNPTSLAKRIVLRLEWSSDNLVTASFRELFDGAGQLIAREDSTPSYVGQMVSGWSASQESFSQLGSTVSSATGTINYDPEGRPIEISYEIANVILQKILSWRGQYVSEINTTTPSDSERLLFTLTEDGKRIASRLIEHDDHSERYEFIYDENERLKEIRIDGDNDGEIDVVQTATWEDEDCETTILWHEFAAETPMLTVAAGPYQIGTGYTLIDYCDTQGHLLQ